MVRTVSRKLRRCVEILADEGIRRLCVVAREVLEQSARQAFYKNRLLRGILYPKLTAVHLELTNDCNLNCKMCPFRRDPRKTGYMSWSLFTSCVNQLSKIGLKNLSLHFGGGKFASPKFQRLHEICHLSPRPRQNSERILDNQWNAVQSKHGRFSC